MAANETSGDASIGSEQIFVTHHAKMRRFSLELITMAEAIYRAAREIRSSRVFISGAAR